MSNSFKNSSMTTELCKEKMEKEEFLKTINEIIKCLKIECFRPALALALTLPDICAKVHYKKNNSTKTDYVNWCNEFFKEEAPSIYTIYGNYEPLKGEVCYELRCSFLHAGNIDVSRYTDKKTGYSYELCFYVPKDKESEYRINTQYESSRTKKKYLYIDIRALCEALCISAKSYYENCQNKSLFNKHIINIRDSAKINREQRRQNKRKYKKVTEKIIKNSLLNTK